MCFNLCHPTVLAMLAISYVSVICLRLICQWLVVISQFLLRKGTVTRSWSHRNGSVGRARLWFWAKMMKMHLGAWKGAHASTTTFSGCCTRSALSYWVLCLCHPTLFQRKWTHASETTCIWGTGTGEEKGEEKARGRTTNRRTRSLDLTTMCKGKTLGSTCLVYHSTKYKAFIITWHDNMFSWGVQR